jgi:hypothetical protein
MIRKIAETFLRISLFAACGGNQQSAQSPGAMPSPLGGPCIAASECQSGLFCEKGDPGGQCLKKCVSSADCGAGAVCNDDKRCYRVCQSNTDCGRSGYECGGASPNRFCDAAEEDETQKAIEEGEKYGR